MTATMKEIWKILFSLINMVGMAEPARSKGEGQGSGDGMVRRMARGGKGSL